MQNCRDFYCRLFRAETFGTYSVHKLLSPLLVPCPLAPFLSLLWAWEQQETQTPFSSLVAGTGVIWQLLAWLEAKQISIWWELWKWTNIRFSFCKSSFFVQIQGSLISFSNFDQGWAKWVKEVRKSSNLIFGAVSLNALWPIWSQSWDNSWM